MLKKKLYSYKKKTITLDELRDMTNQMEYLDFARLIDSYVKVNILRPINNRETNGRNPALHNKYKIIKPNTDFSKTIEDIKLLHPIFDHFKYVQSPIIYIKYKSYIDSLSKFLWEKEEELKVPASINERSFQIWGEEKLLKDKSIIDTILKFNGLDLSYLNYYETPEPFFEYVFSYESNMNILIIENKDTWFTLRKIIREENVNTLYRSYNVLLYGEGKKIIGKADRLNEYDNLLKGSENNYFYFGDLDYEGINIYQTLLSNNENLNINLCTELYSLMLEKSIDYKLPNTKDGQREIKMDKFLKNFSDKEVSLINDILTKGFYIPQEILNYQILRSKILEGRSNYV